MSKILDGVVKTGIVVVAGISIASLIYAGRTERIDIVKNATYRGCNKGVCIFDPPGGENRIEAILKDATILEKVDTSEVLYDSIGIKVKKWSWLAPNELVFATRKASYDSTSKYDPILERFNPRTCQSASD